jgi:Family of unknown function (DUF6516)
MRDGARRVGFQGAWADRPLLGYLTTERNDGIHSNMKAVSVLRNRVQLDDDSFVELVIWKLPKPLAGSTHDFKYRLALVSHGICVMRYDNEAGKGDHRHIDGREEDYEFENVEKLNRDFWLDVEQWRQR